MTADVRCESAQGPLTVTTFRFQMQDAVSTMIPASALLSSLYAGAGVLVGLPGRSITFHGAVLRSCR